MKMYFSRVFSSGGNLRVLQKLIVQSGASRLGGMGIEIRDSLFGWDQILGNNKLLFAPRSIPNAYISLGLVSPRTSHPDYTGNVWYKEKLALEVDGFPRQRHLSCNNGPTNT